MPYPPPATSLTPPGYVTLFGAAVETGRSIETLRRRIKAGTLPAYKLPGASGAYLIARDDLVHAGLLDGELAAAEAR